MIFPKPLCEGLKQGFLTDQGGKNCQILSLSLMKHPPIYTLDKCEKNNYGMIMEHEQNQVFWGRGLEKILA